MKTKTNRVHISLSNKDSKSITDNLMLCPKCSKTDVKFNEETNMYEIYCDCKLSTNQDLDKTIQIYNMLVKSGKSYHLLHTFGREKKK